MHGKGSWSWRSSGKQIVDIVAGQGTSRSRNPGKQIVDIAPGFFLGGKITCKQIVDTVPDQGA